MLNKKFIVLHILIILMLVLYAAPIIAQNDTLNPNFLRISNHYGFIIPHNTQIKDMSNSQPWGIELEVGKILLSPKSYSNCNCFSKVGLSLKYCNFQNPEVLGDSYTAEIFGEPYLGYKKRLFTALKAGMGISYLSKIYDESNNPENLFFGSHLSFYLLLNLSLNFRLNDASIIQLAGNYNHISNAGIKEPNKGMNFPTLSLGYQHNFKPVVFSPPEKGLGFLCKKWHAYFITSTYIKTIPTQDKNPEIKMPAIDLNALASRGLSAINGLIFGFEWSYSMAISNYNQYTLLTQPKQWTSFSAGNIFVFGRFSLIQQLCYALSPLPFDEKSFFQRYGVYYRFGKHILLGASLKAHGHVADIMDLRIGCFY